MHIIRRTSLHKTRTFICTWLAICIMPDAVKPYKVLPAANFNEKPRVKCQNCANVKEHHAKGFCYQCYRKVGWVREKVRCKNCARLRLHKAFGLCGGCHTRLHHYEKTLAFNAKKYHGITDFEFYKKITSQCASCGFDKIVQIHHLDGNTRNNDEKNVAGLCPNCHKMIHMYQYFEEIKIKLKKKGYAVDSVHPTNFIKK